MKKLLLVGALAALAACDAPTDTASGSAVDPFLGKVIASEGGTSFLFAADGTIEGTFRGEAPIVGTYTADGREVCSTYSSPEQLTGREYCSVPDITGNQIVFNRRDGSQSPVYVIQ